MPFIAINTSPGLKRRDLAQLQGLGQTYFDAMRDPNLPRNSIHNRDALRDAMQVQQAQAYAQIKALGLVPKGMDGPMHDPFALNSDFNRKFLGNTQYPLGEGLHQRSQSAPRQSSNGDTTNNYFISRADSDDATPVLPAAPQQQQPAAQPVQPQPAAAGTLPDVGPAPGIKRKSGKTLPQPDDDGDGSWTALVQPASTSQDLISDRDYA